MPQDTSISPSQFADFQRGDEEAMCEIFRRYHKRLIAFVRIYTRNREAAEEVTQEVFLEAYRQRNEIRSASGLRSWLFTVAKRKALRLAGRGNGSFFVDFDNEALEDLSDGHSAQQARELQIKQTGKFLQEALAELKPRDRELVTLRYFGGLQVKEISDILDIPMGSVGVFLSRSLEKIRGSLENQGISIEDLVEPL